MPRSTRLDIFRYGTERPPRESGEFESLARRLANDLTTERLPIAVDLARLP